jgi:hypothetical protein
MIYDTRCAPIKLWDDLKDFYIKDGNWEIYVPSNETVLYLRKHRFGEPNTTSEGWSKLEQSHD